jgi:hypothetical protein
VAQFFGNPPIIGSQKSPHSDVFRTLAETTDGAYFEFNPAVERIAERLPRLLEAVTHYAIGGTDIKRSKMLNAGTPERVIDGVTGFHRQETSRFAEAAVSLLTDDSLWRRQHDAAIRPQQGIAWAEFAARFESHLLL